MSGGSQHPNGRQAQLTPGWSPLQLQMASYLARAPQAHLASERGVTWHTPTPPPHLYHVPAPSPPDHLQVNLAHKHAMKVGATASNSVFRHTATPPDLYRHTPTPPDKHSLRHTPSPGDAKGGAAVSPDLYPPRPAPLPLAAARRAPLADKLARPEDVLAYTRGGVDLSLSRASPAPANGAPAPLSLSVRDAPTINSLIARAAPRPPHARVDALLERLVTSPASPHSVIVHPRAAHTPSPPSSNEDSADSCGAPPGAKRKRKPERTVRLPAPLPHPAPHLAPARLPLEATSTSDRLSPAAASLAHAPVPAPAPSPTPPPPPAPAALEPAPRENGGPVVEAPHTRRKTRAGSAETIDEIAAMIASTQRSDAPALPEPDASADVADASVTIERLESVLTSPEPVKPQEGSPKNSPIEHEQKPSSPEAALQTAAAPRRRSARISNSDSTYAPVESPSEAKSAETFAPADEKTVEPTAASFVEVENELEKMFAGIEEEAPRSSSEARPDDRVENEQKKGKKRRKSAAPRTAAEKKARASGTSGDATTSGTGRKRSTGSSPAKRKKTRSKEAVRRDAYDSGSNASSGRSRGPYIQILGPRDSPASVSVVNVGLGDEDAEPRARPRAPRAKPTGAGYRNGVRARGLHCSTLGARYDATTADASWVCAFCERGPHAGARERAPHPLGDLFGPYAAPTDGDEFAELEESERHEWLARADPAGAVEVWTHEECAAWAPGVLAVGARLWGLAEAVWRARGTRCGRCARGGAGVACGARGCGARTHVPCARLAQWALREADFRALCPHHA